MNIDLVERYIYAVTKRMPGKMKKDVALELQTLIYDMLEERCGEIVPQEKDVRVVLTELGTPEELYEKYTGDSKQCLIGAPYYAAYKFVMQIVLICAAFGLTAASLLGAFAQPGLAWPEVVFQWMGAMWSGLIYAFAFVTALFAFFYHKGIPIDTYQGLEKLPPVPKKNERISKSECVAGMIFSIIFAAIFLVCPQIFCLVTKGGEWITFFNTEAVRGSWYIIILFGAVGIFKEIIKLLEGKYSYRVAITIVITDILSGLLSIWWLLGKGVINKDFFYEISVYLGRDSFMTDLLGRAPYLILGIILAAIILDIAITVVKVLRSRS